MPAASPFLRLTRLVCVTASAAAVLAALSVPLPAQEVDALQVAYRASGARWVRALHVAGFGARYATHGAPGGARRYPVGRYEADIDLVASTAHLRFDGNASEPAGLDARETPHGFLRTAVSTVGTRRQTSLGLEVGVAVDGYRYVGIIDDHGRVDRVRRISSGGVVVETFYRDYERHGLVMYPRHITQYRNDAIVLDVWTSSVDARRASLRPARSP